jgi:rSAM/selenodomain-associated transferase 1
MEPPMPWRAIILMARAPGDRPGKSRLHPALGADRARALHRAFVDDQSGFLRALAGETCRVELCLDGRWDGAGGLPVTAQGPGDLGERIHRALARVAAAGAAAAAVLGADAPTLPRARVEALFALLDAGSRAAVIPAEDGGYVAVGVRGSPPAALFSGIPWGSADVLDATRTAARRAGIPLAVGEPWFDVDRPGDLPRLARSCAEDPLRAPRTAALLKKWGIDSPGPGVV